jgi:hypothetical protein
MPVAADEGYIEEVSRLTGRTCIVPFVGCGDGEVTVTGVDDRLRGGVLWGEMIKDLQEDFRREEWSWGVLPLS